MTFLVVYIGEPADALNTDELLAVLIHTKTCCFQRIAVRYAEFPISTVDAGPQLYFILHHKGENLLVRNGVNVANNKEFFAVLNELSDIFAK